MVKIPNFPDYYVTYDGRVLSKKRKKPKWLSLVRNDTGHLHVWLFQNNHNHLKYVHQLVLVAFVGPCPKGMECRHLDGNPENNHLSNLCWGTKSENRIDLLKHETCTSYLNKEKVLEIDRLYKTGKYTQKRLGVMFRVTQTQIYRIVNHIQWKHIW